MGIACNNGTTLSYRGMLSSAERGKDAVQRPKKTNRVVLPRAMLIASIRPVSLLTCSVSAASTIWFLIAKHYLACPRDIMLHAVQTPKESTHVLNLKRILFLQVSIYHESFSNTGASSVSELLPFAILSGLETTPPASRFPNWPGPARLPQTTKLAHALR